VAERIRKADAMVHLVAINLEDELRPRATGGDPASAVAVVAEVVAEAAAVVVAVEAVVEAEAVDVAAAVADDDAS